MDDSRDLALLDPDFRARIEEALAACASQGVTMLVYHTVRSPMTQAKLWRQSRTTAEIVSAVGTMRSAGAAWLASVLEGVGPQSGPEVTGALPGLSWHQWGLAVDAVPVVGGRSIWGDERLWSLWHAAARKAGCYPASMRRPKFDRPHVQAQASSPLDGRSWSYIDAVLEERWS